MLNTDTLYAIITFFDSSLWDESHDGSEKIRLQTLHRLARVSKLFNGIATAILWRRMHSVLPIFKLLSAFKIFADNVSVGAHMGILQKCPSFVSTTLR